MLLWAFSGAFLPWTYWERLPEKWLGTTRHDVAIWMGLTSSGEGCSEAGPNGPQCLSYYYNLRSPNEVHGQETG